MMLNMKKWLDKAWLLLVVVGFALGASVKPLYFDNIDPADQDYDSLQQASWENLVKYKLWGTNGIFLNNNGELRIEETSGYNGTADGNINFAHDHHLGGPILVGGNVNFQDMNVELLGGPVRVLGAVHIPQWRNNELAKGRFDGPYCVRDSIYGAANEYDPVVTNFRKMVTDSVFEGDAYSSCPETVPQIDTMLKVPEMDYDTVSYWEPKIELGPMSYPNGSSTKIAYIHVPPDSVYTNEYGTVDKFIESIYVHNIESFRIYVVMPPGGRLTRIFIHEKLDLDNSAHNPRIQVLQVPEGQIFNKATKEWDLTGVEDSTLFTYVNNYRGNLLFYTKQPINWGSTDHPEYQGTFITTDTLKLGHSFSVAGQLIAKYIYINTPFTGNFKYVPFDPPVLDLDPEVLAQNTFPENNQDALVPVRISETTLNKVSFDYCFDVKDSSETASGSASVQDFKVTTLSKFPVCGVDTGTVEIKPGSLTPDDEFKVYINAIVDALEEKQEILLFRVFNMGGAVLPGNLLEGSFNLKIVDRFFPPLTQDATVDGVEDETLVFTADDFYFMSTSPVPIPQSGIVVVSIPAKGTMTYLGEKVTVTGTKPLHIPLDSIGELKYTADKNEYNAQGYASFVFAVEDDNGVVSDSAVATIRIKPANDAPVAKNAVFTVKENNANGETLSGKMSVTDIDDSVFTYAFDTTDPNFKKVDSLFTIDLNTGSISVKDGIVFDYETMGADTAMTVKIVVSDKSVTTGKAADIKSSFATATIKILDANESPLLVDQQFAVDEHMPRGTVVDTVVFDDLDKDPIKRIDVFTAVGGDTAYFSIDQNGVIRTKKEFDYETERRTYTIDVALTDKNDPTLTVVRTMTIDIRNVNENPVITTETISVKENPEDGTIVDTLEALDKDIGDTNLVFTLLEDPSGCFDVTEGGVVTVKKCKDLDYEKTKNIPITVKVEDPHGGSSTRVVYVNVIDVPSPSVEITQAENSDSTWKFPDSIWTKQDVIDVCWEVNKKNETCADTTLKPGENHICKEVCDVDGFEGCATDCIVVFYSDASPVVTISAAADANLASNIYTVVEQPAATDTNVYVKDTVSKIRVTVTDKDPIRGDSTYSFTIPVDLSKKVNVPKKSFDALSAVAKQTVSLDVLEPNTTRTPINGENVLNSYPATVAGTAVTVSYVTDSKGNVVKQAVVNEKGKVDSIEVITVSYEAVVDGQKVTISYQADATTGKALQLDGNGGFVATKNADESSGIFKVSYEYTDKATGNSVELTYVVDQKGNMVKNPEGDRGYQVSYTYVDKYGNAARQSVFVVLDQTLPKVEILAPENGAVVRSNFVNVKWTIDGIVQDTLTLQGLEKGPNVIVRFYRDKAGNEASDTVYVVMKDSKEIDIAVEQPVTKIDKDKVDEYYAANPPKKGETFAVSIRNPSTEEEVETLIGGEFKTTEGSGKEPYPGVKGSSHLGPTLSLDINVPTVSGIGGLATLDDLILPNGRISNMGIGVDTAQLDEKAKAEYAEYTVEEFVSEFCEDGVKLPTDVSQFNLYDSKVSIKIWVYSSLGNFVNYFSFEQELNDPSYANEAGMLQMFFEMKPDKDGNVHADNGKLLATGAYVYKVEAKLRNKLRCSIPPFSGSTTVKTKGDIIKTSDELLKPFGYKRPLNK